MPGLFSVSLNCWAIVFYCVAGILIIAAAAIFLYSIDQNFFGSLRTAAPLGAVFAAMIGLFGYLISAEREARRLFLEKQLESCVLLAEAAQRFPSLPGADPDATEWEAAWSRLSIFSDSTLDGLYKKFVKLHKHDTGNMREHALCLARMCRVVVHASWSIIPGLVREDPKREEAICSEMVP
jgi:hypothetical protein